jgi:hypothetical protein
MWEVPTLLYRDRNAKHLQSTQSIHKMSEPGTSLPASKPASKRARKGGSKQRRKVASKGGKKKARKTGRKKGRKQLGKKGSKRGSKQTRKTGRKQASKIPGLHTHPDTTLGTRSPTHTPIRNHPVTPSTTEPTVTKWHIF